MEFLVSIFGWESLIFIAFMTLCCLWFHIRFDEKAVVYGPTILTTTGIFATFVGIALSLKSLNTNNIQESIPFLLNGLKTAFWASVFGVGFALLIKFRFYLFGVKSVDEYTEPSSHGGAGGKDLSVEMLQSLVAIKDGISGDGSNSLIYQIRTLRDDSNKRLDDLKETQKESLRQLTEMSSKTLVEALRDVIRDFNDKVTEQFGENFKELNSAVGKLLEWQDKYRFHIESVIDRHDRIVASMQSASDSYAQLVSKGESFSKLTEDLSQTLGYLDTQKNTLNQMLEHLTRLVDTASGRIPEVEQRMIEIATQLASSIEKNQELLERSLQESAKISQSAIERTEAQISQSCSVVVNGLEQASAKTNANILEMSNSLGKSILEGQEQASSAILNSTASFNDSLREMAESTISAIGSTEAQLSQSFAKTVGNIESVSQEANIKIARVVEIVEDATLKANSSVQCSTEIALSAIELTSSKFEQSCNVAMNGIVEASDSASVIIANTGESLSRAISESHSKVSASVLETANVMKDSVRGVANDMQQVNEDFNAHVNEVAKKTGEQVNALNKGLEDALSKSLGSLAGQLASLSRKFVDDYTPLTDRLREVVGMARRL